jgi:hypothetical protein
MPLSTDITNLAANEISFLNNLSIGYIDPDIPSGLQFTSSPNAVHFMNAALHVTASLQALQLIN